MAVESVTFINSLDASLPSGGDSIAEGDDHIRNLKKAVKNTFPNLTDAVELTNQDFTDIKDLIDNSPEQPGSSSNGIVASCKYNGTNIVYQEGVSTVTEVSDGNYRVVFDSSISDFDQHYAPIVTAFRSLNNRPVIVSLVGFSATQLDFSMTELPGDGTQLPSKGTGFSMLIVDMIQN
jgi:hypothetical protein